MPATIPQRLASDFLKLLADPDSRPGARTLHEAFHRLYEGLRDAPDRFGLTGVGLELPPDGLKADDPSRIPYNRKYKLFRDRLDVMLDLLMAFGLRGRAEGAILAVERDAPLDKLLKELKKILPGMAEAGFSVTVPTGRAALALPDPDAAARLRNLASQCSASATPALGRFRFARCDFRSVESGKDPDPEDLFRLFEPGERERVAGLHRFFTGRGYAPAVELFDAHTWSVKYQGRRKVKATPLFQVESVGREPRQLRVLIKCASANRLVPVVGKRSDALQADFFRRTHRCNAPTCHWCKNSKALGPSVLAYKGESRTVCWYVNPDVRSLDAAGVKVIEEYAIMHEELA